MKAIIVTMAGIFAGVQTINAQTDTVSTKASTYQANPAYQSYPTPDMQQVKDIPSTLRTTLSADDYKGWENGTVYFNTVTGEYALRTMAPANPHSSNAERKTTWYHFDKSGKRLPDKKKKNE